MAVSKETRRGRGAEAGGSRGVTNTIRLKPSVSPEKVKEQIEAALKRSANWTPAASPWGRRAMGWCFAEACGLWRERRSGASRLVGAWCHASRKPD